MARYGHMYTYDAAQNVTFPAGVTAKTFNGNLNGNANTATKLTTSAGSATQPIYFSDGKPVATTYALNKTVPSDAKFTDTTYSDATTSTHGLMSTTDKTKLDKISAGSHISGKIDWQHRFYNMQQHSGEHIFSGIVHSRSAANSPY